MTERTKKDAPKRVSSDIIVLIAKKMLFFQDIIQKTILHVQRNKMLDIVGISEVNNCINTLFILSKKIKEINEIPITVSNTDNIINVLQNINNELSSLFKVFGTESFEDLLWICFGNNSVKTYAISDMEMDKFELLKKYFHPTSYRLLGPKKSDADTDKGIEKDKICDKEKEKEEKMEKIKLDDCCLTEKSKNLDIAEVSIRIKSFHLKVYGIQIIVHNPQHKKSLIITGTVDDIIIDLLENKFVNLKIRAIQDNAPNSGEFKSNTFSRYIGSLGLKDYLIYEPHEIYSKYAGYLSNLNNLRQKTIAHVVKEFVSNDLFLKRITIIQLLIQSDKHDNQYLSYLLYDLLSNDANGNVDTQEQVTLFDSFPWSIKQHFKDAMTQTIKYTNDLTNFDSQKIPLEQQICLLKAPESVKEKAMQKLKEVKAKTEDSGSKARQYLDGLLKIPFCIYKREPILNMMNIIKSDFTKLVKTTSTIDVLLKLNGFEIKENYTNLEILKYLSQLNPKTKGINKNNNKCKQTNKNSITHNYETIHASILGLSKPELLTFVSLLNDAIKTRKLKNKKLRVSNKNKLELITEICEVIKSIWDANIEVNKELIRELFLSLNKNKDENNNNKIDTTTLATQITMPLELQTNISQIEEKYNEINTYMNNVKSTLDKSVYGHERAKKHVERIIGQWVNGNDNTGYVLGFEGAPGIGKTTLAKGLANCLKDADGNSRPFSLIAIGGDANSSSLVGHSYTYVGSTWGQIVQILMDKKCMNPIILIDEVDKISKTEHGKEIIGILTHLLDTTQNECFQDKYFSGIELDLSKALFILSYNDVESIDKILLDRVHRIKFDSLSIEDKIVICNNHLLPEIYKKMGLENMISFADETLKFIIEEYTLEPGVRKLKEKLFEIIGELNLELLKTCSNEGTTDIIEIPIKITVDDIKTKYFKDKREIRVQKIHEDSKVGVINCLYATSSGNSGILSASAKFCPTNKFLELKLTGLLDQMMQESFQISLTLAYSLLSNERKHELSELYNGVQKQGIHLHMGDGSISKSGTSAGIAITLLMYSLLNNVKIKNTFAVTGEASDLNGNVGEIGALAYKFQGGIKAGVKSFIFPKDNKRDYDDFMKKYGNTKLVEGISFNQITHISEAIELIME
jgi:ATP-dependent Lon protease